VVQLRTAFRLRASFASLQSSGASGKITGARSDVNAITFTETIHGRTYVIVTSPVGPDRWRAEVARTPGVTTSLMPFYGPTPDAAAGQLAVWLERAGNRSRTRPGV